VALNCGAVSSTLIESELFGHERGSFTGADRLHRGVFERATGGTLFLDEVTEMPIELQARLLRMLETGSFTRTGGETPVPLDVRFLASTNRKPEEAVRDGRLREDLYYRLKVFQLSLPPVRERPEDIATLSEYFLRQIGATEGTVRRLAPETLRVLQAHSWPGNVRELRNTMYSAYILARDEITPADLPRDVRSCPVTQPLVDRPLAVNVGMTLAEAEERLIAATLTHFQGSKLKAAKVLGVSLKTLYNRVQQYSAS
jgi:DNA-binding NtrC family response regulator